MASQTVAAVIMTMITFSLTIEWVRCGEYTNKNNTEIEEEFVCEEVITNYDTCATGKRSMNGVKMVKKCHSNYTNDQAIKKKCEQWPTDENYLLKLSAINTEKNIVYWNMYCALCNFDHEFEFEIPLLFYATIQLCGLSDTIYAHNVDADELTQFEDVFCNSNTTRYIPQDELKDENYCTTPNNSVLRDPVYSNLKTHCNSTTVPNQSIFCPKLPPRNDILDCSYGSDYSKECRRSFYVLENTSFAYGENEQIYTSLLRHNPRFFQNNGHCSRTNIEGVLYCCLEEDDRLTLLDMAKISSHAISIVFLLICLILNTNKRSLHKLPNRSLYSLCIAQLLWSAWWLHTNWFPFIRRLCFAADFIDSPISLSAMFWCIVVLFEYGRLTYYMIHNRKISAEGQMKKFFVYCLVCWILPAISLIFSMVFISRPDELLSSCPQISDYQLVRCERTYDEASDQLMYVNILLKIYGILTAICIKTVTFGSLGIAFVIAYLWRQDTIRSSSRNRNYLLIYAKIMIAVSAHLAFQEIYLLSEDYLIVFNDLFRVTDGFLGVFIFFAFYYKKNMFSNILMMVCKLKKPPPSENGKCEEHALE